MADEVIKVLEYITNNEVCQFIIIAFVLYFLLKTMRWFE